MLLCFCWFQEWLEINQVSLTSRSPLSFVLVSCSQVPTKHYYSQVAKYDYYFRGIDYEFQGYRSERVVCPCCHFGGKKEELNSMERLRLCFRSLNLRGKAMSAGGQQEGVPRWKASLQGAIFNPNSFLREV